MDWIFFFGKNSALSLSELSRVLQTECPGARIAFEWKTAALVNGALKPGFLAKRLGGTLKIAAVMAKENQIGDAFFNRINAFVSEKILEKKFFCSLSTIGEVSEEIETKLEDWLKKRARESHQKAIFKHGNRDQQTRTTSPKEIASWKLLETNTDFVLAKTKNEFLFAYTVGVSDPREWKNRDENRPFKDNKEITSIRLAKILVNLAGLKPGETVLDPFCGYATILQEALLSGFNAIGTEKNPQKVLAAEQNLKWIKKQFLVSGSFEVIRADATQLSTVIPRGRVHGVVTEPYLGPYFTRKPTVARAQSAIHELNQLYKPVFFGLSKILSFGQRVVIVFPRFEIPNGFLCIDFKCFGQWFEPEKQNTPNPFFYQNQNNKIGREIWVLKRK